MSFPRGTIRLNRRSKQAIGLTAWYPFINRSVDFGVDMFGENDLTVKGSTARESVEKNASGALRFNNTNVNLETSDLLIGSNTTFTIWARLKWNGGGGDTDNLYLETENDNSTFRVRHHVIFTDAGILSYDNFDPGGNVLTATNAVTSGQVHDVCVVRAGSTLTFYLDGEANGSGTPDTYSGGDTPTHSVIGHRYSPSAGERTFANYTMIDFRIYNGTALSPAQVKSMSTREKRWDLYDGDDDIVGLVPPVVASARLSNLMTMGVS